MSLDTYKKRYLDVSLHELKSLVIQASIEPRQYTRKDGTVVTSFWDTQKKTWVQNPDRPPTAKREKANHQPRPLGQSIGTMSGIQQKKEADEKDMAEGRKIDPNADMTPIVFEGDKPISKQQLDVESLALTADQLAPMNPFLKMLKETQFNVARDFNKAITDFKIDKDALIADIQNSVLKETESDTPKGNLIDTIKNAVLNSPENIAAFKDNVGNAVSEIQSEVREKGFNQALDTQRKKAQEALRKGLLNAAARSEIAAKNIGDLINNALEEADTKRALAINFVVDKMDAFKRDAVDTYNHAKSYLSDPEVRKDVNTKAKDAIVKKYRQEKQKFQESELGKQTAKTIDDVVGRYNTEKDKVQNAWDEMVTPIEDFYKQKKTDLKTAIENRQAQATAVANASIASLSFGLYSQAANLPAFKNATGPAMKALSDILEEGKEKMANAPNDEAKAKIANEIRKDFFDMATAVATEALEKRQNKGNQGVQADPIIESDPANIG